MKAVVDNTARDSRSDPLPLQRAQTPLGALFIRLLREAAVLARKEVDLAKAEISEKASAAASGARQFVAGGAVFVAGFIILLMAASNALMLLLPPRYANWLAPLLIGGVVVAFGSVLLVRGNAALKAGNLLLSRTVRALRRDGQRASKHPT